jgi:hypothetical protein
VLPLITVVVNEVYEFGEHHPIGSEQPFCLYQELGEDGGNVVSLTPLPMLGEAILPPLDARRVGRGDRGREMWRVKHDYVQ